MGHHAAKKAAKKSLNSQTNTRTSWEPVAPWYNGWVGKRGSIYHRKIAIPTVLRLAELQAGERLLDIGCGQGVLAPHILKKGAAYVGVDASKSLIHMARKYHGKRAAFLQGDARYLHRLSPIRGNDFDVAVFMLSIQDMQPLNEVLRAASWALGKRGRLIIFMLHPCFRVPRQSGWGFDAGRKLTYRRVDRYLSELKVPMKAYAEVTNGTRGTTLSFHRPLTSYINTLAEHGLVVDKLEELPDPLAKEPSDIPMFAALRAKKMDQRY